MDIRKATLADLEAILAIYSDARAYMRKTGNMTQWTGGHPAPSVVEADILAGDLYLCTDREEILGVFFFQVGDDPTYGTIYDGAWRNDRQYAVIHRIAVSKNSHGKGVAAFCFAYCYSRFPNLKIDTHRDNLPMQRALLKNGFSYCGIIHLLNGDERLAYQKCGE